MIEVKNFKCLERGGGMRIWSKRDDRKQGRGIDQRIPRYQSPSQAHAESQNQMGVEGVVGSSRAAVNCDQSVSSGSPQSRVSVGGNLHNGNEWLSTLPPSLYGRRLSYAKHQKRHATGIPYARNQDEERISPVLLNGGFTKNVKRSIAKKI